MDHRTKRRGFVVHRGNHEAGDSLFPQRGMNTQALNHTNIVCLRSKIGDSVRKRRAENRPVQNFVSKESEDNHGRILEIGEKPRGMCIQIPIRVSVIAS
jgi:hypothetical protein